MLKKTLLFYLLGVFTFSACTSGKKAFQNGDYPRAIYLSVDRLRKSPDHSKSRQTLGKAYQLYLKKSEEDARNIQNSVDVFRWDKIVDIYQGAHDVYDQVKTCPAALEVLGSPKRFDEPLQEARKNASKAHYELGIVALAGGTREKSRQAYYDFKKAQDYYPNLQPDLVARLNDAKQKATLRVGVLLFPINSSFNLQKYALIDAALRNPLNLYVQELEKREFLDAEAIAEPNAIGDADDLIKMAYTNFLPEQIQFKEEVVQRLDSIKREQVINGQTFLSYEKVWAEIGIKEKTLRSTAVLELIITDTETGQILFNQSLQAEYIWKSKWATLRTGDIRATTPEQQGLLAQQEAIVPNYQTLFDALQTNIFNQLKVKVNGYYKAY